MKRGSEFVADVAVGEASQIVFPVHDCLEEFGVIVAKMSLPERRESTMMGRTKKIKPEAA